MKFTEEQLEQLRKNYNLAEEATEEEVQQAILNAADPANDDEEEEEEEEESEVEEGDGVEDDGGEARANSALLKAINGINKRLNAMENNDKRSNAEKLIDDEGVAKGKILPADRDVWVESAIANYDKTKSTLEKRKVNSALIGAMQTDEPQETEKLDEEGEWKKNSRNDLVDHLTKSRQHEVINGGE